MSAESGCVPCGGEAGWHGPGCPAAPVLVESSPVTRAMLALAEELAASPGLTGRRALAARIRATLAAVLAADPNKAIEHDRTGEP